MRAMDEQPFDGRRTSAGFRANRMACPLCGRDTAYAQGDKGTRFLRRHKRAGEPGRWCSGVSVKASVADALSENARRSQVMARSMPSFGRGRSLPLPGPPLDVDTPGAGDDGPEAG